MPAGREKIMDNGSATLLHFEKIANVLLASKEAPDFFFYSMFSWRYFLNVVLIVRFSIYYILCS